MSRRIRGRVPSGLQIWKRVNGHEEEADVLTYAVDFGCDLGAFLLQLIRVFPHIGLRQQ